jgi:hypothetical protein
MMPVRRGLHSPLLGQGGVAAPVIKWREASSDGADGVVGSNHRLSVVETNHPVRSNKGGFAAFLLMSRPPLLGQGGDSRDLKRSPAWKPSENQRSFPQWNCESGLRLSPGTLLDSRWTLCVPGAEFEQRKPLPDIDAPTLIHLRLHLPRDCGICRCPRASPIAAGSPGSILHRLS